MNQAVNLLCGAALEWSDIQAAGGTVKVPGFAIVAYTGGPMKVPNFFRPVVVDLSGVRVAAGKVPLLRNHDPDRIVGHAEVTITPTEIRARGIVSADNEHSRDVLSSAKKGFPWQISIGASPLQFDHVPEGRDVRVNGRRVAGPVLVSRRTLLQELSFVPLGADSNTSAHLAAGSSTLADLHRRRRSRRGLTLSELRMK